MGKTRDVEQLADMDTVDYNEVLRKREVSRYENELALIEKESPFKNLPSEIAELNEQAQYMLYYFLTPDIYIEKAQNYTKNNMLLSFIMTFPNYEDIINKLFYIDEVVIGYDKYEREQVKEVVKKKDIPLFTRWNMRATRFWSENNLDKARGPFKAMLQGNVDKNEVIKDEIYDDALNNPDERIRMQNRRLYTDISGMKDVKDNHSFNVFVNGGGMEKAKAMNERLGTNFIQMPGDKDK